MSIESLDGTSPEIFEGSAFEIEDHKLDKSAMVGPEILGNLELPQDSDNRAPESVQDTESNYSYYIKKLKYEASLAYTKLSGESTWWTKIEPFNLYLGALPLGNEGHLEKIINLGVTDVLSMVEAFEVKDGWFNQPIKQQDWEAQGVTVKNIQAADFLPLKQEEIEEGVQHLNRLLLEGRTIYVHCKAGRGRSASIVMVYLMKFHGLSYNEAFELIKEQRPQINLNYQQRLAILEYFSEESPLVHPKSSASEKVYAFFQNGDHISEESLETVLNNMLHYVINGASYSPEDMVPETLSTWIPSIEIQSTLERRDRYLREYRGDQEAATKAAIERNHGLLRRFKKLAANAIPFIGTPTSYSISLWHQLREITLIAAIHGHDLDDPEVKMKILSCLVGGNLLKAPAQSVDVIARLIAKKIMSQVAVASFPFGIPTHLIFNYFTDNSAKVSTHAKELFAGKHSIPVSEEAYL